MKIKEWEVSVLDNKPIASISRSAFFTSDTDAWLGITLTDGSFNPPSATVILKNQDGSIISEGVDVVDDTILFPMYIETQNLIEHYGNWELQIIYIKDGKKYTSGVITFAVEKHLLAEEVEPIEKVENWQLIKGVI